MSQEREKAELPNVEPMVQNPLTYKIINGSTQCDFQCIYWKREYR
jgi:hypothetical protein